MKKLLHEYHGLRFMANGAFKTIIRAAYWISPELGDFYKSLEEPFFRKLKEKYYKRKQS